MIHELRTVDAVRSACGDDDLLMWAAQGLAGGARVWALGDAVVAACPQVSRADRVGVWGGASCAAELVRHALAELGPSYRLFGEVELVRAVTAELDGLRELGRFSWMSLDAAPAGPGGLDACPVAWLDGGEEREVAELLAADAPASYAVPGVAGVRRWAGIRLGGELAAVAADAWSAPTVGLLAGVATRAVHRGRGLAGMVCRWVSAQLVAVYGRAALMVNDDNAAALALYGRIGYRRRRLMASSLAG